MAQAKRDNRRIMPRSRNVLKDLDSDLSAGVSSVLAPQHAPAANTPDQYGIVRYGVLYIDSKGIMCPDSDCNERFEHLNGLVTHISHRSSQAATCVLCPGARAWTHTDQSNGRKHIRSHLPKSLECPDCSFHTRTAAALYVHRQDVHVRRNQIVGFTVDAGIIDTDADVLQAVSAALKKH